MHDIATQVKLIIWDLDDTLWRGTLDDQDAVILHEDRARMVRDLNRCGIVSAVCSKNDLQTVRNQLQQFGLWDEFVFPRIAFTPKGAAVRELISDMQLRPANVLFIDNDPRNLAEVREELPEIHTANARLPESDHLVQRVLDANADKTNNRREQYRMLEARLKDKRTLALSNEDFLRSCDIHIVIVHWMDNLEFRDRIVELINRSNQMNYTETRTEPMTLTNQIMNIRNFDSRAVFAYDKYGYQGLVGFALVDRSPLTFTHFVFSCRVMHMGMEAFLVNRLKEQYPALNTTALPKTIPAQLPVWIKEDLYANPVVRSMIMRNDLPLSRHRIALRIMYDCQSAGIAHYSRWRNVTEFDNLPRLFSMPMMATGEYAKQEFPSLLVYGAGIDYLDWRWNQHAIAVNQMVYRDCVQRFCSFVLSHKAKILVILPPENAADDKYFPNVHQSQSHTRERAVEFNAIWKECAPSYSGIFLLSLNNIIEPAHMLDASHYYPEFLKILAGYVDKWVESESTDLLLLDNATTNIV